MRSNIELQQLFQCTEVNNNGSGTKMETETPWKKITRQTKTKMDRQSLKDFSRNWNTRWRNSSTG